MKMMFLRVARNAPSINLASPEMVRYLLENPKDYVFSALTASIAVDVQFDEFPGTNNLGTFVYQWTRKS